MARPNGSMVEAVSMVTGPVYHYVPGDLTAEDLHYRRPGWVVWIDWDRLVAPRLSWLLKMLRGWS